jgi:hypothetical protein
MSRFVRSAMLTLPALLLAACGGGGGDAPAAEPAPAPVISGMVITTANAKAVSIDALDAATNVDAAQDSAGLITGVQVEGAPGTAGNDKLAAAALVLAGKFTGRPSLVTGVAVNETLNCTQGGTLSMSGNVNGSDWLMAGDTITLTAGNCRESVDGVLTTMNGRMTISITKGTFYSAAMAPFDVTMEILTQDFSTATGGETITSDGDMTMAYAATTANVETLVFSGASQSTTVANAGGTRGVTMKSYRQQIATNWGAASMTVTMTVESTNPRLAGGTVRYDVTSPSAWTTDEFGNIVGGSLQVVGQGSQLLITATSSNGFSIDIDTDGDGTYDETQTATLAELRALR